jgi:hypothetical protein
MPFTARPEEPTLSSGMRQLIGSALCTLKLSDIPRRFARRPAGMNWPNSSRRGLPMPRILSTSMPRAIAAARSLANMCHTTM